MGSVYPGLFFLSICFSCSITHARRFDATESCVARHHALISEQRWAEMQPPDQLMRLETPPPTYEASDGVRVA